MADLIPARWRNNREMLDSVFLLNYARRIEGRARWTLAWHVLLGALLGYGLGEMVLTLKDMFETMSGGMVALGQLLGRPEPVKAELWVWMYLPWLMAGIFAVLGGAKGMDKSDDMRFKSQLALHMLRLQQLVKEQINA